MPFLPGQSGNPSGKLQEKVVTEALRAEAYAIIKSGKHKGLKKLRVAARKIVDRAVAGELAAFNIIIDRLEGKPMQQSETKLELGASDLFLEVLRRMQPAEPKTIEHEAPTSVGHVLNGHEAKGE